MLQIDHIYEFLYQELFKEFKVHSLPGGVPKIIVDDYDYFSSGAKLAVEHFLDAATLGKWKCEVADRVYGHFATLIREK